MADSSFSRRAASLALITAVISGVSNFVNKFAVTAIKDAVVFTTFKNALVAVLLLAVLALWGKRGELHSLSRKQWLMLLAIGVVGGSLPFALYFTGLQGTSALNAALIHKTLFIWVALLALPFLDERLSGWQWGGAALLLVSNVAIGGFTGFRLNGSELMILAAVLLWAVENIIAKKVLAGVSSMTVAAARMGFGALVLGAYLFVSGRGVPIADLSASNWGWVLLTAGLLFGYVTTWYAALKRAPATVVAILLVPATLVTNILSAPSHVFSDPFYLVLTAVGLAAVIFGRHISGSNVRVSVS